MASLVTLETAKLHLRIADTDHDADIALKSTQASAIVLDYLTSGRTRWENDTIGDWTDETVDPIAQSAILDVLGLLYEHRGDDFGVDDPDAMLWDAIRRRLARLRDPAIA